jgi:hypothetical protein
MPHEFIYDERSGFVERVYSHTAEQIDMIIQSQDVEEFILHALNVE